MKRKKTELEPGSTETASPLRYHPDVAVGLSREQVAQRMESGLGNVAVKPQEKTVGSIIKSNLFTYYNLVFAVLTVLLIAAESFRSLTFLPVVVANLLIGIVQEIRAKKTLDALTMLNAPRARVVREGKQEEIPAEELVLDDIVLFRSGDQICADAVVLEGSAAP